MPGGLPGFFNAFSSFPSWTFLISNFAIYKKKGFSSNLLNL